MRGATLAQMVNDLRIEARFDPDPALSVNIVPLLKRTLVRTQEFLYDEFDWPFLRVTRDINIEAGSRYYDFPDDLNLERVQRMDVLYGDQWRPVERRIDLDHYNAHDSDTDQRLDPVQLWDVIDTGDAPQIEIWPVPATAGRIRLTGIRSLSSLVEDADRADLDDMMIVLYAAGELLATAKDDLAEVKFSQAKARRDTMQGRTTKTRNNRFSLGGCPPEPEERERVTVAYARAPAP